MPYMISAKPLKNELNIFDRELEKNTDIKVQGTVISKKSYWVNTTESNVIKSTVKLSIKQDKKDVLSNIKYIEFEYLGGTIGGLSYTVRYNPHGILSCDIGDEIILYGKKKSKDSKLIEAIKIDVLNDAGSMMLKSGPSYAIYEEHGCEFEYLLKHWDSSDFPISYYVNPNCHNVSGLLELGQIQNAFSEWELTDTEIDFTYAGSCSVTYHSKNGKNELFWGYSLETFQAAVNHYWDWFGEFEEIDIEFNQKYPIEWTIGADQGFFDVRSVATHEIGHFLGLQDCYRIENDHVTMYYNTGDNTIEPRELKSGDILGAKFIYPDDSAPSISVVNPGSDLYGSTEYTIQASVSCADGIDEVKYKVTHKYDMSYDTGWVSMSLNGAYYEASWTTPWDNDDFYITVKAISDEGCVGINYKTTNVNT